MPSVMGKIGRGFNRMSVCIFRALGIHKGHWSILFHSYSAFLVLIWFKMFSAPGIKLNTHDQAGTSTQNKRGKRKPLRYKVIVGSRAHHSLPWIEFATLAVGFFSVYNFFLMLKWSHVYRKSASTASSLCTNFQAVNLQRCQHAFPKLSEIAACPPLLLLMILQLHHLPLPLPLLVSSSSCLFTQCQPLYASCCTGLVYFSRHCIVRWKCFIFLFNCFICIICVKSIINLL